MGGGEVGWVCGVQLKTWCLSTTFDTLVLPMNKFPLSVSQMQVSQSQAKSRRPATLSLMFAPEFHASETIVHYAKMLQNSILAFATFSTGDAIAIVTTISMAVDHMTSHGTCL